MRRILKIALIAIIAAPMGLFAQNDQRSYIMQNYTCEEEVTPDELYISININEKDNKGKKSVEQMQQLMIKTLEELNIDVEKSLTLNYMGSEITYSAFRHNVTPRTSASYTLKLNSAATMQKIIAGLEAQGITNIQLTRTKYSKEEDIYKKLGAKAMKSAQEEAANLAQAIGQKIGPAISINSNRYSNGGAQPRIYKARASSMYENADLATEESPQVEIGKITYNVNVNVKFLLSE